MFVNLKERPRRADGAFFAQIGTKALLAAVVFLQVFGDRLCIGIVDRCAIGALIIFVISASHNAALGNGEFIGM